MGLNQFGAMVGALLTVDEQSFDDVAHAGPSTVVYHGPDTKRRLSGAPLLQGPVSWECRWQAMVLDDFQALYTIWNLNLNTTTGPMVRFAISDPREAGSTFFGDYWMDEPQFEMSELLVRNVVCKFTQVIE